MKTFKIIFISFLALFVGIIYFAFNKEWIIFRRSLTNNQFQPSRTKNTKKECTLTYWNNNEWHHEKIIVLWSDNQANNCKQLINELLLLWDEEHLLNKKITLESALISASGQELFLSFSRNLFDKEEPLFIKWMRIESILKTISNQHTLIQQVRFLVQHQPLRDTQLDFSQSWPIQGFLEK
jgi:hypothetical protein